MNHVVKAFVLLLLFLAPFQAFSQSEDDELFSTAQRAFDDGFHDVSIRYLEEYLPKYPQSPRLKSAQMLLGQAYFFRNEFDKALEMFKLADGIKENKDMLLFWKAEALLKLLRLDEAALDYEELLENFKSSVYVPQALYSLGWLYYDQKQYALANEHFIKLANGYPKHQLAQDALLKIAQSSFNLGDYQGAIRDFNRFIAAYPQSQELASVYLNIADSYYYMEDYDKALASYDLAIKSSQDPLIIHPANVGRIWSLTKKKQYDQALKLIKEALDFAKQKKISTEDLLLAAGQLSFEKGDLTNSLSSYNNLINDYPTGQYALEAYLGKANALYGLGKYLDSVAAFKYILDHQHNNTDIELVEKASFGLGWANVKSGNLLDGIRHFQSVFEKSKIPETKINALVQMADAYHDANKFSEAAVIYENISKTYLNNYLADYVQYRLAMCYLKLDKLDLAQKAFNDLNAHYPRSQYLEDMDYFLGVLKFKSQDWAQAAQHMDNFLKALTRPSDFAPEANYILALSYLNLKQCDDSLKVFQKILRLYPDDDNVAKNADIGIAKCQFELGQTKEAVKRFKMIIYKYPKTEVEAEALLWLAQHAMKESQYDKAIEFYKQILERFPNDGHFDQIHYELGQAYEVQGVVDQALVHYKAVSTKDEALASKVKLAIAGIFSKEFDPQKALLAYENIAQANSEYSRDAYMKMAQIHRNAQDYEKEMAVYEKALKVKQQKSQTTDVELLFDLGDVYEVMGRMDEAIGYYLKIPVQFADQLPWVVKAYLRVGKIYEDRRDWEGARVTYQKIIQLKTEESKFAQERLDLIKRK